MRRSLVIAIVLCAIAFVLFGGPSLLLSPTTSDVAPPNDEDPELVEPEGSDSGFWPYLSAREAHDKRSPINLIVRGDSEDIVRLLSEAEDGDWEESEHDHFDEEDGFQESFNTTNGSFIGLNNETGDRTATETDSGTNTETDSGTNTDPGEANDTIAAGGTVNESGSDTVNKSGSDTVNESRRGNGSLENLSTNIPWAQTTGATRYAYIDPGDGEEPYWTTETMQVDDGTYYGQRYHIRLYESPDPDDEWVAMQAHSEHFDWFTLRHRVDGASAAQSRVERDFMSVPTVDEREDVRRIFLDNGNNSGNAGWATEVDLRGAAIVPIVVGLAVGRRTRRLESWARERADRHLTEHDREQLAALADRLSLRHLALAGSISGLLLGVRLLGIGLERHADVLSMHAIAAVGYPFIALGIPVATYLIAHGLEHRLDAAIVAASALAVAIWIDYGYLGVDRLPVDVVLQRMLVIVALGLIAAGAARRAARERRLNDMLVVGVTMWAFVLLGTLFGLL